MRAVGGIIAGLIVGLIATILVGIVGVGATLSGPVNADISDPRQVVEAFANMSSGPKIALMLAWFAGGLAGALVAKLISRRSWAAWTVAILIALYVVLNTLVLPLPGWMQALSIAAPLIGALIGNHLVKGSAAVEAATVDGGEVSADL
jgi:uncharacterized membrane protein YdcZ (DUF606 family)